MLYSSFILFIIAILSFNGSSLASNSQEKRSNSNRVPSNRGSLKNGEKVSGNEFFLKLSKDVADSQMRMSSSNGLGEMAAVIYRLMERSSRVKEESVTYFAYRPDKPPPPTDPIVYLSMHTNNLDATERELRSVAYDDASIMSGEEQNHMAEVLTWTVLDMIQLIELIKGKFNLAIYSAPIREFDNKLYSVLSAIQDKSPAIISNLQAVLFRGRFYTGTFYDVMIDLSTDILAPPAKR